VAFRDDREALEARLDALETEVEELRSEVDGKRGQRDAQLKDIRARARRRIAKAAVFPVLALAVAVAVLVGFVATGDTKSSETLYGVVREASPGAPVQAGSRCAVFIEVTEPKKDRIDASVLCDGRAIYGAAGQGSMQCEEFSGMPPSCADTESTGEDGDPRFRFDRGRASLEVDDANPSWSLRIDLGPWARPFGSEDE
jgi:hypothetical protein